MAIIYTIAFILLSIVGGLFLVVVLHTLWEDSEFEGTAFMVFIACTITILTLVCSIEYIFDQRLQNNEGYIVKGTISYEVDDMGTKHAPSNTIIIDKISYSYDTSLLKKACSITDIKEYYKVEVFVIPGIYNDYIREVKTITKVIKKKTTKSKK